MTTATRQPRAFFKPDDLPRPLGLLAYQWHDDPAACFRMEQEWHLAETQWFGALFERSAPEHQLHLLQVAQPLRKRHLQLYKKYFQLLQVSRPALGTCIETGMQHRIKTLQAQQCKVLIRHHLLRARTVIMETLRDWPGEAIQAQLLAEKADLMNLLTCMEKGNEALKTPDIAEAVLLQLGFELDVIDKVLRGKTICMFDTHEVKSRVHDVDCLLLYTLRSPTN